MSDNANRGNVPSRMVWGAQREDRREAINIVSGLSSEEVGPSGSSASV
jgi:hypothetical protein